MAAPVTTAAKPAALARQDQTVVGLGLAAAVVGALAGLHAYSIFVFELGWATAPIALVLAALQCWLFVGVFIVAHDAMHGSLAPGRPRLNSAIGATLLFLYAGFSWTKLRDAHFAHHRHAGTAQDPDFCADHPRAFWPWYATFLKRYFGIGSVLFVTGVFWLYHLAFDVGVGKMLLFYAVPSIGSSLQLFYFGTFRPHRHGQDGFVDRHNARSDSFGPLASLASCFHFGYHHEHHCHPDTPWWALPRKRASVLAGTTAGEEAGQ